MRGAFVMVAALTGIAHADSGRPAFDSPSVVMVDGRTHRELIAKHADEPRAIASMTRVFVVLVLHWLEHDARN